VFNIEGSELIFLLLVALVVLGPEKLPDAIRKFGKGYAEFKKTVGGFQGELRQVLDEPMKELRDTADAVRQAARFDVADDDPPAMDAATPEEQRPAPPARPVARQQGLNFGSANPRRVDRQAARDTDGGDTEASTAPTDEPNDPATGAEPE